MTTRSGRSDKSRLVLAINLIVLASTAGAVHGCVRERCYVAGDCDAPKTCSESGICIFECTVDADCSTAFYCNAHQCRPRAVATSFSCPSDMVKAADAFCIDKYEASKPDAAPDDDGVDGSRATSVFGVLPWRVENNAAAQAACTAAGKRLCEAAEWQIACEGPNETTYAYGNQYNPTVCNGIDTFGRSAFHLMPTGSFQECTNPWGLFDMNGNLWEHTANGTDATIRGGAYNCSDSASLHRCDYIPGTWTPSARGFRCCLSPDTNNTDTLDDTENVAVDSETSTDNTDSGFTADTSSEGGCINGTDSATDTDTDTDSETISDNDNLADTESDSSSDAPCPPDMVPVNQYCIDRYEASREDATPTFQGNARAVARSRPGVLPWYVNPMTTEAFGEFDAACRGAGKRLCAADEWFAVCEGPSRHPYFFGSVWDPAICNSVDTFCQTCCEILGIADCPTAANCGYSAALSTSPYEPETCFVTDDYSLNTCPVCFHVMPTGAFSQCTNETGAYDINGNLWETVSVPMDVDSRGFQLRGGAFNCGSPSARFQCTYNATWSALYAGFRCCKDRHP